VIPGPRPSEGHDRPTVGRDRGSDIGRPLRPALATEVAGVTSDPPVSLTRTSRGWSVTSAAGTEDAADLVEGLSLADLVAEELGALVEPDRTARRSARGPSGTVEGTSNPVDARVAELERTVAQLEHALAARVSTERAIGVLAERHGISARSAFESLRGDARSQGRPVAQLARQVLDGLDSGAPSAGAPPTAEPAPESRPLAAPTQERPAAVPGAVPGGRAGSPAVGAADGRP
jgi:hypothetical protein